MVRSSDRGGVEHWRSVLTLTTSAVNTLFVRRLRPDFIPLSAEAMAILDGKL
jgi:hypothetical protein